MRTLTIALVFLLTGCGKSVYKQMVAPDSQGQAIQRNELEPKDQLAFDRYVQLGHAPYVFNNKQGDTVETAVKTGKSMLQSDASGETVSPIRAAELKSEQDRVYQTAVSQARHTCDNLDPALLQSCRNQARSILRRNGVPESYIPF